MVLTTQNIGTIQRHEDMQEEISTSSTDTPLGSKNNSIQYCLLLCFGLFVKRIVFKCPHRHHKAHVVNTMVLSYFK